MSIVRAIVCFLLCGVAPLFAAGPKVTIVVGAKAEPIEKFAADEMAGQLKKLFDAEVTVSESPNGDNVIHLGTQASSPIAAKLGDAWPKLSEQGHALKTIDVDGKSALLVAGGSPRAALWAAYELGWQFGIRYFAFGDHYPVNAPSLALVGYDVLTEPVGDRRRFGPPAAPVLGPWVCGRDDYLRTIEQGAKLKGTEIVMPVEALLLGKAPREHRIRVDGDTAGRAAFRGAKYFENPDFAEAATDSERDVIGAKLVVAVQNEAQRRGIEISPVVLPNAFDTYPMIPSDNGFRALAARRVGTKSIEMTSALFAEWLNPVCGEGVAPRVEEAFRLSHEAFVRANEMDPGFSRCGEDMLLRFYNSTDPPPPWWNEVRKGYLDAMNEMYRANTRAREGGRGFTLYYARLFEFGFEYMNAVEALRKAAIAKKAGNNDEQIAELEKALDSITNACNAMAAVARSQSDRGVIAVMNEYGYRPVTKLLEAADAGN